MSTRSLLAAFAVLVVPSVAAAQPSPVNEPPPNPRLGFFGGGGLYAGEISCEGPNCSGVRKAGGGEGHVGWNFSPVMGIIGDLWWMESREDNVSITYINASVGLRYWIAPILYGQVGLGNGHASIRYDSVLGTFSDKTDNIPTVLLSLGLELVRGPRWALDVNLRVAQGSSTDGDDTTGRMTGIGIAATFF